MKKRYFLYNGNNVTEFDDLDEAVNEYSIQYKEAKELVLKDSNGIILAKKLED